MLAAGMPNVKLAFEPVVAEWRNWQTHQTQNLAKFTLRVGSTPTSATKNKPLVWLVQQPQVWNALRDDQLTPGLSRTGKRR